MMHIQFDVASPDTPDLPKWEADLEYPPRVGDNLTFEGDQRDDGEPIEYTVKRVTWHVMRGGGEAFVLLHA